MIILVPKIARIITKISIRVISGYSFEKKFCTPLYPRNNQELKTTAHSKIAANP
jgi:hypothetical protein